MTEEPQLEICGGPRGRLKKVLQQFGATLDKIGVGDKMNQCIMLYLRMMSSTLAISIGRATKLVVSMVAINAIIVRGTFQNIPSVDTA